MNIIVPEYIDCERKSCNDNPGTMYYLKDKLDESLARKYRHHAIVHTGITTYKYAPEQKFDFIWVSDKAKKSVRYA
ncbi:hypothetical protein [Bifidobacterium sp. SO1]|uniref:hypothetical protein n=1 Tax=Bifidobacterium sp. SO1 TaxID=2809029 RepID=UPI001BDD4100|nr:hypothetical protein [Bifidobacterium sp. SO1]MBT1162569.1 hypothetical protein [Bifidobacterium sp. SO1]